MAPRSVGINWQLLTKIAGLVSIVGVVLVFWPTLACAFGELNSAQLPTVISGNHQQSGVQAILSDQGFFGRLGSSFTTCATIRSPLDAPVWQQGMAGLGLFFVFVFRFLGGVEYRRRVRKASQSVRQNRASMRRTQENKAIDDASGSSGRVSGAHPALASSGAHPALTSSGAYAALASSGSFTAIADSDPLALLDAEADKSGD